MSKQMRKIPKELENPIDNVLIDVAEYLHPLFYALNFTPNGITFLSGICQFSSLVLVSYDYYLTAGCLFFLGYFWDVMDGNYARKYKMTSPLGDKLDHYKDIVVMVGLGCVTVIHPMMTWPIRGLCLGGGLVFTGTMSLYLAAQDQIYAKKNANDVSQSLQWLSRLCTYDPSCVLRYVRWMNTGSANLVVSMTMISMKWWK